MNKILKAFNKLSDVVASIAKIAIIFMMALMSLVIIYQVIVRYVIRGSLPWSEEFARYLMAWVAFLGASLAIRSDRHIGVEMFVKLLPKRLQNIILVLTELIILVFFAVIVKEGFQLCSDLSFQRSPAMRISMFWPYLSVPVGCTMMIIQMFPIFLQHLTTKTSSSKKVN